MLLSIHQILIGIFLQQIGAPLPEDQPRPNAALLGLPSSLADDAPSGLQEDDRKNEFAINVNLWPILESTTLPTGERRTALWPLFHVSTMPKGGVYSWHV